MILAFYETFVLKSVRDSLSTEVVFDNIDQVQFLDNTCNIFCGWNGTGADFLSNSSVFHSST